MKDYFKFVILVALIATPFLHLNPQAKTHFLDASNSRYVATKKTKPIYPPNIKITEPIKQTPRHTIKPKAPVAIANSPTPAPAPIPAATDHNTLLADAGINASDYRYADYIINHESSWNVYAVEPTTQATGLCQALPASKMSVIAPDYLTNAVTQLKWCAQYADKYGGWHGSYAFWVAHRWW